MNLFGSFLKNMTYAYRMTFTLILILWISSKGIPYSTRIHGTGNGGKVCTVLWWMWSRSARLCSGEMWEWKKNTGGDTGTKVAWNEHDFFLPCIHCKNDVCRGIFLKDYIEERAVEIADYIIENNATVRQTAKRFRISKSTVHKDGQGAGSTIQ